jgi:hypothetical protein
MSLILSLSRIFPKKKECAQQQEVLVNNIPQSSKTKKVAMKSTFFSRLLTRTGIASVDHPQVPIDHAAVLISVLPVPICIISTKGTILSTNSEFRAQIDIPLVRTIQNLNMLELIALRDQEKFSSKLNEIKECRYETTMISVGTCITRKLVDGVSNYEPFDWTMSPIWNEGSINFIMLTGGPPNTSSRSEKDHHSYSVKLDDHHDEDGGDSQATSWKAFQNHIRTKSKMVIALKKAQIMSEAAVKISSNQRGFIRQLSHEIRTPLNIISASLSCLETFKEHVDSSVLDIIADIESASSQSVTVLDNFLVYERLESNSLVMNRHSANVLTLVDEAVKSFKAQVSSIGFLLGTSNLWHRR